MFGPCLLQLTNCKEGPGGSRTKCDQGGWGELGRSFQKVWEGRGPRAIHVIYMVHEADPKLNKFK